jgi:ATP-dependent protease ClpP protease subunit
MSAEEAQAYGIVDAVANSRSGAAGADPAGDGQAD